MAVRSAKRLPAWTLAELCDRLSEERLEVLSASRDSCSGAVRLEVIATRAMAPAEVLRARRIAETTMGQPYASAAVHVRAVSPDLAFA